MIQKQYENPFTTDVHWLGRVTLGAMIRGLNWAWKSPHGAQKAPKFCP